MNRNRFRSENLFLLLSIIESVECIMDFFLCVLGMVMIVEGLPYFAFPESTKSWVRKIIEIPVVSLRKIGFILMIVGLLLVYIGKR